MYSVNFTNITILLDKNGVSLNLLTSNETVSVSPVTICKLSSLIQKVISKFEARKNSPIEIQNKSVVVDNLNVYIDFSQNVVWISSNGNNNFSYLLENELNPFIKISETILNILPLIPFINNNSSAVNSQQIQKNTEINTEYKKINEVNNKEEQQIQTNSNNTTKTNKNKNDDGIVIENIDRLHEVVNVIVTTKKVKDIDDKNLDELKQFMNEYWKIDTSKISNQTLRNILEDIIISIKDYLKNDNDIFALAGSVIHNKNTKFIMKNFELSDDRSEKLKMIITALFMKELLDIVNIAFTDNII